MTEPWGMNEWVETWKKVGPQLQAQRDDEIRNSDTAVNIAQLDWSYKYVRDSFPVENYSGLVDFYRILLKGSR